MEATAQDVREIRTALIAEGEDAFVAQMAAGFIAGGMDRDDALRVARNSMID